MPKNERNIAEVTEEIFQKSGAIFKGHYLLTSGLHSPVYWEKFRVLQSPVYTETLCRLITEHYRGAGVQVVAGPTTGGIILAYEVARELGVRGIFAEREGETERAFRRGFYINPGEKVLIVDDILTTGGSIRQVISAVQELGGNIIGLAVLVDRSEKPVDFGNIPFFACLRSRTEVYKPEECPQCKAKIPLIRPGGG
ncbi:MAG: orotate phosphoribosyltransferase [Chloroflexota bacterium]